MRALWAALVLTALALTACGNDFERVELTIAAGSKVGVYNKLSTALAEAWTRDPGIRRPEVLETSGSVQNLHMLRNGEAHIGFSAADAAEQAADEAEQARQTGTGHRLFALARMHDDYLQVLVRADLSVTRLTDLVGMRVSLGAPDSGVKLIADRLLASAEMDGKLRVRYLDLQASTDAIANGELDAFFWSGGVPTDAVTTLATKVDMRMLDLSDVLPKLRADFPVYGSATLPASAYRLDGGPVVTLVVRNFLMVNDTVTDDVAEALLRGLFRAQPTLVSASPVARSIEVRSAIETTPVPLHPGAMRYYRDAKV
ncbi:TAXI family TRAP transporter solute-binding subunit [Saccharothrix syringae]|uniref:TAXI family TRAP transporter solute-binding subunit n=1 Tax=Saccharothrix syringae TaxID=103733 RepID=A0A5Q0HDR0_SACSY|nr:TAXI family TRAP transporter solute-binding subunit [Saccharothrix syringae]